MTLHEIHLERTSAKAFLTERLVPPVQSPVKRVTQARSVTPN